MNVWLAKAEESYLVSQVITKRLILVGEEDDTKLRVIALDNGLFHIPDISGTVELAGDTLRVFKLGAKIIEKKIRTEAERLELLKCWFGIELTKDEQNAILGRPTELKS